MAGRLTEPKIITDFNQQLICILPPGFYFSDERWEQIWQRYDETMQPLTSVDLLEMFPDEKVLERMVHDGGSLSENEVPEGIQHAIEIRNGPEDE